MNAIIRSNAERKNKKIKEVRVHSSDVFYHEDESISDYLLQGCSCVEMESYALFHNAEVLHKKAACLLTISDSLVSHEQTSAEQREVAFSEMMELALESVEDLYEI